MEESKNLVKDELLTKKKIEKRERDEQIKSMYDELISQGGMPSRIHTVLAERFNLSLPTVIRAIKGAPVPRRKKRLRNKVVKH